LHTCLRSDSCSSGRDFAPRFLQTVPRGSALALRSYFTSIRLYGGLSPPSCWACPAHSLALRATTKGGFGLDNSLPTERCSTIGCMADCRWTRGFDCRATLAAVLFTVLSESTRKGPLIFPLSGPSHR